jgi:hypothetical protein
VLQPCPAVYGPSPPGAGAVLDTPEGGLGWLWPHESGTYVKFTAAGAEMFA